MFCSEWALVKFKHPETTVEPLRCKCWTCDECAPRRKARLIHEARAGKPNLFWTLTTHRKPGLCPHKAARDLVRAWRTVRAEYTKKNGKGSLPFLCVLEETKRGWPHLHLVGRCKWLDQFWLSKRMGALIGAPIVDVRRARSVDQVIHYVTKYIAKKPARFRGTKRYWRSLDYLDAAAKALLHPPKDGWSLAVVKSDWRTVVASYSLKYYLVIEGFKQARILPRVSRWKHLYIG